MSEVIKRRVASNENRTRNLERGTSVLNAADRALDRAESRMGTRMSQSQTESTERRENSTQVRQINCG